MRYRTALYGRTSSDDDRRVTIEIQQRTLRDWTSRDPLVESVVDEFWDQSVSGKIPLWDRPRGTELLAAIQRGDVQAVAVVYIDRFGRTLLDGLQAAAKIEQTGCKIVAVNDGWDARRNDDPLYFQFRLMLAEAEHRRIRDRMSAGRLRAMDRDNAPPAGGPVPFGYLRNARGQYELDPIEAPIVIRMFQLCLEGKSNTEILAWVQSVAAPGRKYQKRGGEAYRLHCAPWTLSRVGKTLRRRCYIGEHRWKDRVFPCPPLIDHAAFDRVQEICRNRAGRFVRRGTVDRALLSGLLACSLCGHRMYFWGCRVRGVEYPKYRCLGRAKLRTCKGWLPDVQRIDSAVWELVEDLLCHPETLIPKLIAANAQLGAAAEDLTGAEREHSAALAEIESEVAAVWAEQSSRGWPMQWVAPRLDALKVRRDAVAAKLTEVRDRRAMLALDADAGQRVIAAIGPLGVDVASAGPERKAAAVRALVDRITVCQDGELKVHLRGDVLSQTVQFSTFGQFGYTLPISLETKKDDR